MKGYGFFLVLFFIAANVYAQKGANFGIEEVKIKIYDNEKDGVVKAQTNPYGNGMDLFISVLVSQSVEADNDYLVEVRGFGKGRENEAEGLVEDYKTSAKKTFRLYQNQKRYIPFIVEFSYTSETNFTVTLTQKSTGKKVSKTVKTQLGNCNLN